MIPMPVEGMEPKQHLQAHGIGAGQNFALVGTAGSPQGWRGVGGTENMTI